MYILRPASLADQKLDPKVTYNINVWFYLSVCKSKYLLFISTDLSCVDIYWVWNGLSEMKQWFVFSFEERKVWHGDSSAPDKSTGIIRS